MSKKYQWRPAWIAAMIVVVLGVALTFEPMRAFASSFLNIFRVQQVTVLPIDMNSLKSPDGNPTLSQALRQMFTSSTQVTRPGEEPQTVADATEATQVSGFNVRLWQDKVPGILRVESGTAFDFTVNLQQVRDVIQESGLQGPDLPQELDGVKVSVNIPASVTAGYGDCKLPSNGRGTKPSGSSYSVQGANCIFLVQMPSPTLSTNPDVNTAQLAEIGLQFLGMKPEEAHNLGQSIDWTSTLVIPVPLGKVDYQKVDVDGVTGNLIHASVNSEQKPADTYNLIWIKDGILYTLSGASDPQSAIDIANSLR